MELQLQILVDGSHWAFFSLEWRLLLRAGAEGVGAQTVIHTALMATLIGHFIASMIYPIGRLQLCGVHVR